MPEQVSYNATKGELRAESHGQLHVYLAGHMGAKGSADQVGRELLQHGLARNGLKTAVVDNLRLA